MSSILQFYLQRYLQKYSTLLNQDYLHLLFFLVYVFCIFFLTFFLNTLISTSIYSKFIYNDDALAYDACGTCERCAWYVRTMHVENENSQMSSSVLPSTQQCC